MRDHPHWWRPNDLPRHRLEDPYGYDYDEPEPRHASEPRRGRADASRSHRFGDPREDMDREGARRRAARYRDDDDPYRRERPVSTDRRPRHAARNWADKAGDEMKSWFGDREARRRRQMDRAHDEREDRREHERERRTEPMTSYEEDEELCEAICAALDADPQLDATDIHVRVIDNEAILDGSAPNRAEAARAYDIACETPGIVHVRQRLRAHRSGRSSTRAATIGMGFDDTPPRRH